MCDAICILCNRKYLGSMLCTKIITEQFTVTYSQILQWTAVCVKKAIFKYKYDNSLIIHTWLCALLLDSHGIQPTTLKAMAYLGLYIQIQKITLGYYIQTPQKSTFVSYVKNWLVISMKNPIIQTLHNETLQNTVWVLLRQFNVSRTYQKQPGWTNVGSKQSQDIALWENKTVFCT